LVDAKYRALNDLIYSPVENAKHWIKPFTGRCKISGSKRRNLPVAAKRGALN
jgi:hypothetical protein